MTSEWNPISEAPKKEDDGAPQNINLMPLVEEMHKEWRLNRAHDLSVQQTLRGEQ